MSLLRKMFIAAMVAVFGMVGGVVGQEWCLYDSGDCWPREGDPGCQAHGWVFQNVPESGQGEKKLCAGGVFTGIGQNQTPPTSVGVSLGCCKWATNTDGACYDVYTAQHVSDCSGGDNQFWAQSCPVPTGTCPVPIGGGVQYGFCQWGNGGGCHAMDPNAPHDDFPTLLEACMAYGTPVTSCGSDEWDGVDRRPATPQPMTTKTAMQYFTDEGINLGINVGNTLDAVGSETSWGNPKINQQYFNNLKAMGINIIRLPVTYTGHIGDAPNYTINEARLARLAEVINMAKDAGLKVFINIHHDGNISHGLGGWLDIREVVSGNTEISNKFEKVWEQIAEHLKDYGDYLMFQAFNEIHRDDWAKTASQADYNVINDWNQRFTDAVRRTGSNNTNRYLLYYGYNVSQEIAGADKDLFKLPTDPTPNKRIVGFHYYDPFTFSHDGAIHTWDTPSARSHVDNAFGNFKREFVDKGIPVIIGENGPVGYAGNPANAAAAHQNRLLFIDYMYGKARENGIVPFYWETGVGAGGGYADFSLINRSNGQPNSQESRAVIERMVSAVNGTSGGTPSGDVIFDVTDCANSEIGWYGYAGPGASVNGLTHAILETGGLGTICGTNGQVTLVHGGSWVGFGTHRSGETIDISSATGVSVTYTLTGSNVRFQLKADDLGFNLGDNDFISTTELTPGSRTVEFPWTSFPNSNSAAISRNQVLQKHAGFQFIGVGDAIITISKIQLMGTGSGGDGDGLCRDAQGRPLSCQWATGCHNINTLYSTPAGLSCETLVNQCRANGQLFHSVPEEALNPANNYGEGVICAVAGGISVDGGGTDPSIPKPITGNMGNYRFGLTAEDNDIYNHAVWELSSENLALAKQEGAQLVLRLSTTPGHAIDLAWQDPDRALAGDETFWWKDTRIVSDFGSFQNGASWNAGTRTLTIDLPAALVDYPNFLIANSINLVIASHNSSGNINDIGIISAELVVPIVTGPWTWNSFTDAGDGGTSTVNFSESLGSIIISGNVTRETTWGGGLVGWEAVPDATALTALRAADAISFKITGDGKAYRIVLPTTTAATAGHRYHFTTFQTTNGVETIVTVNLSDFAQPIWGPGQDTQNPLNKSLLERIQFQTADGALGSFNLTMRDLELEIPDPDPDRDDADITAAKAAIEGNTYSALQQVNANNAEQARAAVQAVINALYLNGVTAVVGDVAFEAAVAGTKDNVTGANGSYTFTVTLNKGLGTQQVTEQLTLTINATPYTPLAGVIWDVASGCNSVNRDFAYWYGHSGGGSINPLGDVNFGFNFCNAGSGQVSMRHIGTPNTGVGFGLHWSGTRDISRADGIRVTYSLTGDPVYLQLESLYGGVSLGYNEFQHELIPTTGSRTVTLTWDDFAQEDWGEDWRVGNKAQILQNSTGFQFMVKSGTSANITVSKIEWWNESDDNTHTVTFMDRDQLNRQIQVDDEGTIGTDRIPSTSHLTRVGYEQDGKWYYTAVKPADDPEGTYCYWGGPNNCWQGVSACLPHGIRVTESQCPGSVDDDRYFAEFVFGETGMQVTGDMTLYLGWVPVDLGTPPAITTVNLFDGVVDFAYSQTLVSEGSAVTWSVVDGGALPAGLTLSANGVISGMPSAAGVFEFTVRAENAAGHDEQELSIRIMSAPVVTAAEGIIWDASANCDRADRDFEYWYGYANPPSTIVPAPNTEFGSNLCAANGQVTMNYGAPVAFAFAWISDSEVRDIRSADGIRVTYSLTGSDVELRLLSPFGGESLGYNNFNRVLKPSASSVTVEMPWADFNQKLGLDGGLLFGREGDRNLILRTNLGFEFAIESGTANITVSKIEWFTASGDIIAAKGIIEGNDFGSVPQLTHNSEAAAKSRIESIIAALPLNNVVTDVNGTFTAAQEGTADPNNILGTDGSYKFTVTLNKGFGAQQVTEERTLVITATSYDPVRDNNDITAAKSLIEGTAFSTSWAKAAALAEAEEVVRGIIAGLDLSGVTAEIADGNFTAAQAGTSVNIGGTPGSYTFIVKLNKGGGSEQETSTLTLAISARSYNLIWDVSADCDDRDFYTWFGYADNISSIIPADDDSFDAGLCKAGGLVSMETVGFVGNGSPDNSAVGFGFRWISDSRTRDIMASATGIKVSYLLDGADVEMQIKSPLGGENLGHNDFHHTLTSAGSGSVDIPWSLFVQHPWAPETMGDKNLILQNSSGLQFMINRGKADFTITKIEWMGTKPLPPPAVVSIAGAEVTIGGTYIYNNSEHIPAASNVLVVVDGKTLINNAHYTYEVTSGGTNAGSATVTVTGIGNYEGTAAQTFTIGKAVGTFGVPAASSTTYTPTLTLADVTPAVGYAWNVPSTSLTVANNGQSFAATFTDPSGNYESATGTIVVNVAKAVGVFGTPSALSTTYTPTLTLTDVTPADGYAWDVPSTQLTVANNGESFAATFTDPSGNYESAAGTIVVNVAKAVGTFGTPSALSTTYTPTLMLADVTPPSNYVWDAPSTQLTVANDGQSFVAAFTDPSGNYESATGTIVVNVAKAVGVFGTPSALSTTYTPTLTLANVTPAAGYVWDVSSTPLTVANSGESFAATFTDPSGNYESATGTIVVNVAKAAGVFGTPSALSTTYAPTLTLSDVTPPSNYVWDAPSTQLAVANDGQSFAATFTDPSGNYESVSGTIVVNVAKAAGVFGTPSALSTTYTPTLTLANVTPAIGYVWNVPSIQLSVANSGQPFAATFTDPSGNYESATGTIVVNVAKAAGVFGTPSALSTTYTPTLTLADLTLPSNYVWDAPSTQLSVANSGEPFAAAFTDPSGNYESATGTITVNVAKAVGTFVSHAVINDTYTPTLKLSDIHLDANYAWDDETVKLAAGNDQEFDAVYTDPSGNYESAAGTIIVNVAKATLASSTPANLTATYGDLLSSVTLPEGWTWDSDDAAEKVGGAGAQEHLASFTPPDTDNYESGTGAGISLTINVAKAVGTFGTPAALSTTYTPTLTLADVTPAVGYVWNAPSTALSAGDGQSFAAVFTDPSGNYTSATGNITVNVAKAVGTFGTPAALSTTYTPTLTLANLTPAVNYVWDAPATSLNAGDNQQFDGTYTDPSGNYLSAAGKITVNVAKANFDMSGVTFADKSVDEDGEAHSILIGGTALPEGVSVQYEGNGKTEVGEHTVTATFTLTTAAAVNYNVPAPRTATLTIRVFQSVLSPDRTPGNRPVTDVETPVTALSGEFTAGPNPVARSAGKVDFFRQGKRVENVTLIIFDASGNVVNKVKISDKASGDQSRRLVGSWNLKDAKGRAVAEGTYLVKGVVKTSDGKTERVSLLLGVR